jgi:hypothetical protein
MDLAEYRFGPDLPGVEPVRKFVMLVLWQAQQDCATELVIDESIGGKGVPIRYLVSGTWYEMTPFPQHIREQVVQTVLAMAGTRGPAQFPWHAEIDIRVSPSLHLRWSVQMPSEGSSLRFRRRIDE